MINDYYGRPIYTERDLVDIYMKNPSQNLNNTLTDTKIEIDPTLEIGNAPHLIQHTLAQMSVADFDEEMRSKWHMPQKYRELDIAKWLLEQCKHEEEFQRVGKELLLYQKRGQFLLLQYMKYLVDLMRENNIVWGVGRGSSVSSFVLFLIGIHRINSIYYDLDVEEFLKQDKNMGRTYKTARGKTLDMASLIAKHEKTRAVSNINAINSRGDEIDQAGNVVRPNTQRVADSYASQVGTQGAVSLQERPENPNISKSANPNAPLSPKQKRELEVLEKEKNTKTVGEAHPETPMLNKLLEESTPVLQEPSESEIMQADLEPIIAPIEPEIAPIPPVEPEEFVMKSADEAPDSFDNAGEQSHTLHPEEAELAELEEDFDIEAIKKAALENIVTEQPKSKKKGKR